MNAKDPTPPKNTAARVLVFGASGYIGSHLVPRLLAEGRLVRAAARQRESIVAREWPGVECVAADALDPDSLEEALAGVHTAYYLVHSMAAGKAFGKLDLTAARNFAAAASAAGVQRIVYLGGLIPPTAETEHIVSRKRTGDILREGEVPVTELRAGIIVGPGSAAFEVMRDLVFHLPVMLTPRWVQTRSPPIALENLLEYMVRLPEAPGTAHAIFDAAGPEYLSYAEMMRILADVAERRAPWIIPVPLLTPRLSAYWLRLVTTVPTPIARALIEGMREDFLADDTRIRDLIPQTLLDFRAAVEAAFAAEREHRLVSRWTEGALVCRRNRPDYAYYAKRASATWQSTAPPAAVWDVVERIGGKNRYFYASPLWRLREFLDFIVGGPGMTYGRRDPQRLRVGDTVDSWRVIAVEPGRRLTLLMGMRAPGAGVLEFELMPRAEGCAGEGPEGPARKGAGCCEIRAKAYWHPAGLWGLLYWYTLVPAHAFLFAGMTRAIARQAEKEVAKRDGAAP